MKTSYITDDTRAGRNLIFTGVMSFARHNRSQGAYNKIEYDGTTKLKRIVNAQGQNWTYGYDLAGRLAQETDWAGRVTTFTRDALGRVLTKNCLTASNNT